MPVEQVEINVPPNHTENSKKEGAEDDDDLFQDAVSHIQSQKQQQDSPTPPASMGRKSPASVFLSCR